MEKWERITALIARIFGYIGGGAVAIMTINILLDATMRSTFSSPIPGTLEYVQYWWMILIGYGGWALAAYRGEHIDAPIIADKLSLRYQLIWRIVAQVATGIYLALIVYYGSQSAMHAMEIGEYQGGYMTPIWIFRFFIPLAGVSFLIVIVHQLTKLVIELRHFSDADATPTPADSDGAAVKTQA
jgi:TRAP-type C4-dicarboxylate transport system permease small subunit